MIGRERPAVFPLAGTRDETGWRMVEERGETVRAHVWVSGRVQGVYFRAYAEDEAGFRQVQGWIRNLRDGRVEGVFEGPRPAVEAMLQWCRRGSPASQVTEVQVAWEPPAGERGFVVRP